MPREHEHRWGGTLPFRGFQVAQLLVRVSDCTAQLRYRKDDALELAEILGVSPHIAWRLSVDTRIALGWSSDAKTRWKQIVDRDYPGGEYPTAEAWLAQAGLEYDGTWKRPEL